MSETIRAATAEPGAAAVSPVPKFTEHPEPGGGELDYANALCGGNVLVEPPTQELVKLLGSLDVGHGDDVDLEVHGDARQAGAGLLLIHVIYLSLIKLNFPWLARGLQPGSLAPSTSIRSIDGACARSLGAFAPSASAIGPLR